MQKSRTQKLNRYCHATASIISSFLTVINHLFTSTYKTSKRTVDPKVEDSSLIGIVEGGNRRFNCIADVADAQRCGYGGRKPDERKSNSQDWIA